MIPHRPSRTRRERNRRLAWRMGIAAVVLFLLVTLLQPVTMVTTSPPSPPPSESPQASPTGTFRFP